MHVPNDSEPDYSDVQSGSSSRAETPAEFNAIETKYTVKAGDTLSHIALHHYGDASKWKPIFDANRSIIENPDRIQIGWVLTIPQKPGLVR